MRAAPLASLLVAACGGNDPMDAPKMDAAIDAAPPACPSPVTEDTADNSAAATAQMIASPSSAAGTSILLLGTPDAGGYASLNGYFVISGLPATQPMNVFLVMGTDCTRACSPMVQLRAGIHPNVLLLGDDMAGGCAESGQAKTSFSGTLPLYAPSTNDGPNYGYLIQIP
jgi:hypothetical protein